MEQPKKVTGGAFGRFLHEKRDELHKECIGQRATAVVKLASARFKALGEAEKAEYQEKYNKAAEQYSKDIEAFLAAGGEKAARKKKNKAKKGEEGAAKKRKKDPNAPKKPAGGGFGCYVAKHREEFQEQTQGQPDWAVAKIAGEKWKQLSEEDKQPYQEEFLAKMEAYKAAIQNYVPPEEPELDEKAAAKQAKKEAKEAKKKAKDEAKETKKKAKGEAKEAKQQAKEEAREAKKQAKEGKKPAKEGKEAKNDAKAKALKAKRTSGNFMLKVKASGSSCPSTTTKPAMPKVELQASVAAQAEKDGLTDQLMKLAARQDIINSKMSQAAMLKALQDNRGLIHPAKRALLGA